MKRTKEEIDKELKHAWSYVDYEVGDWVETCNMLPGIVQEIEIRYDEEDDYFIEDVKIFYPHMAFDIKNKGMYNGGSYCSVEHCGVHKIEPDYAVKLMALGAERLNAMWVEDHENMTWEDIVEEKYYEVFGKK